MEQREKPRDAYEAIEMLGKIGVLPRELAERLSPIASFRNILVHEYLGGLIGTRYCETCNAWETCTTLWNISRNG